MNRITRKILAFATTVALFIVGLPVVSLAASETATQVFSYSGDNFVASDWTGKNNTPTVKTDGLVLSQVSNDNYSTVTYKDTYNLSKGFELTYSAVGRTSYNNIYDKSYYVGVKIGNVTVAMDQYVKPVIMVNGAVKTKGDAIISYSKAADIAAWLTGTERNYSEVKYTATYDGETVTYAKYHNSTKVFEIKYTDTEKLIDVGEAAIALYHKNSWGFNATYYNISLRYELSIPDTTGMPGGACGENTQWAFDETTGTLYITGEGKMDNYVNVGNVAPWSEQYRTQITKVVIGDDVTHIGNRAFKGHNRITTVKFGRNVQTMGYECFYLCNKLEKIHLNEGLTNLGALTFYNCTALKSVTIPSTVTDLQNRAFKGSGLTSIVVPDTVTKMGYEVFMNCASLKEVDFTEGVSMLQPCTFMNCTSLTKFEFTDNMCRIRANAFNGCTKLARVYFEDEAMMWGSSNGQEAKIASNAFEGCPSTLNLTGIKGGHVETYAGNRGFNFVDKTTYNPDVFNPEDLGMKLTFEDNFDGTKLDSTKWAACPEYNRADIGSRWDSDMHALDGNGNLVLKVAEENGQVVTGAIRTRSKRERNLFAQTRGYYEIRSTLQQVPGFWAAFWLMAGNVNGVGNGAIDGVEIDIFESFGTNGTYGLNHALHWDGYSSNGKGIATASINKNYYDGKYHTFGLLWDETGYYFYVDGIQVHSITEKDANFPGSCTKDAYLKITLEAGTWAGKLDTNKLPLDGIKVDYVKVYQFQ